jgi:hypothetical protein
MNFFVVILCARMALHACVPQIFGFDFRAIKTVPVLLGGQVSLSKDCFELPRGGISIV